MNSVYFNENNLAANNGFLRVYDCHPETQEYLGFSDEYLTAGVGLPAHSYLDEPPQPRSDFAICRQNGHWQYIADYRGQTVYNKQTAKAEKITHLGELPDFVTLVQPQTEFDYWDGSCWRTNVEAQKQHLIALAYDEKQRLQLQAEKELSILQRAAKLGLATQQEQKRLVEWEKYSVLLSRIDENSAPNIEWPQPPV
jgi:hypothetical protein